MPTRPSESAEHSFPSNSPTTSFSSASRIITDDTRRAVADLSDEQSVEGGSIREPDDPEVLIAQLLLEENESSSLGVECTFSEGDTLIQEGERRDTCLLLLDGEVKVKKMIYHPDRGTHSIMIRTLYAPCLIGEIALMTDGFATASVIANEHCLISI
jgi:CRP-like cAMP-binding protein